MITDGNATVFISDMNASLAFYTGVLGMKMTSHFDDNWATVAAGGFTIGLHPKDTKQPVPGTHGAIMIGLNVEDIETSAVLLRQGGARDIGEVARGSGGSFLHFHDPDGNALYLWEMSKQ